MARRKKEIRQVDHHVMWKAAGISGALLGLLFGAVHLVFPRLLSIQSTWYDRLLVGCKVVATWLVVSSMIRALNQLRERMPAWQLAGGGILTAFMGSIFKEIIVNGLLFFRGEARQASFDSGGLVFFTSLGIILSLLTMINLRVKNRLLGNVLELLVIIAFVVALLHFYGDR